MTKNCSTRDDSPELRPLSENEIRAVTGAATLPITTGLVSVRQQELLATKQRLEDAYAATHPYSFGIDLD